MHATLTAALSKATVARRTWARVGRIICGVGDHIIGDGPGSGEQMLQHTANGRKEQHASDSVCDCFADCNKVAR